MARGVRQGCTASGFLFAMAFDGFMIRYILTDTVAPDFLRSAPCANADDFAVAASSFRSLMTDFVANLRGDGLRCWAQSQPSEVLLGTIRQ